MAVKKPLLFMLAFLLPLILPQKSLSAQIEKVDLTGYPAEIRALYPLFAQKCSKCHSLSIPLNADFDAEQYKVYVAKMRRKPNSGINTETAKSIYTFIKYYVENKNK